LLTFSVTILPKILQIDSFLSKLQQNKLVTFFRDRVLLAESMMNRIRLSMTESVLRWICERNHFSSKTALSKSHLQRHISVFANSVGSGKRKEIFRLRRHWNVSTARQVQGHAPSTKF